MSADNTRSSGAAGRGALVGREQPLAILRAAIRTGRPCLVRGEAGIGKTALVHEALAGVERPVVAGRGIRVLGDVPYLPLRDAVAELPAVGEPADVVAALRARHAGAIVLIDDLQWCDADTLAVLAELCLSQPLLATLRPESSRADSLLALLAEVGEVVDLGPLDDDAARLLVEHRSPGAPTSDIERWVEGASGNPLMLELAASVGVDATGTRPGASVVNAVGSLDAASIEALARIALAAAPLRIDDQVREVLVAHQFVDVRAGGRVELRHDLVAEAALELIGADRRRALHLEFAKTATDAAARARHLDAAGRRDEVVAAAVEAAADAATVWSRAHYLLLAVQHAEAGEQIALRVDAAEQLSRAGQYHEVISVLEGIDIDDRELAIRAGVALARAHWTETQIDEARAVIAATLRLTAGRGGVAESELLSLQSRILARVDFDLRGAIEHGRASLAIARECGDGLVAAHSALGLALLMVNNPEWSRHIEAAGVYARDEHDVHGSVVTYDILLFGHFHAGDPSRCRAIADEMVRATEAASPSWNGYFRASALMVGLHVDGDAAAVLEQGPRLLERRLSTRSREMTTTILAIARADAGDDQGATELAALAVDRASDEAARSSAYWALAEAHWLGGRGEEAIAASDRALELPIGSYPGRANAVLIGQWTRAEQGLPVDPRAEAALAKTPPNQAGARHELRGLTARDPGEALDAFEAAAEAWEGCSQRAAVRARWAAGEAARRAGRPELALAHLLVAERACASMDLVPLGRRVTRSLRALDRITPSARRSGLFSEAELRVLHCVARGLTTQEIARFLAVKPSTVESHIRAVMRATGATTRMQAATIALGTLERQSATRAVNMVTRDDGALLAGVDRLRRAGATIVSWDALPPEPWTLSDAHVVATGTVANADDVAVAMLAAMRGARIVAKLPSDARLTADLVDGLQRVGAVEVLMAQTTDPRGTLDPLAVRIFDLLAAGFSIAEVAAELGYSRRTIERRAGAARRQLGVATNIEALLVLSHIEDSPLPTWK